LQTFGVLPWNLWGVLWRFWPAIIIAIGITIVFRNSNHWIISVIILAVFLACLGLAIWQYGPNSESYTISGASYSKSLDNTEGARIELDYNVGYLEIAALPTSSENLIELVSLDEDNTTTLRTNYREDNGIAIFTLTTERTKREFWNESRWLVLLNSDVPMDIFVESSGSKLHLNMAELIVTKLDMNITAANCVLFLPAARGILPASIEATMANLEIEVPLEAEARFDTEFDIVDIEIDDARFLRSGDYFTTEDYQTAQNHIDMAISCNIGRFKLR